MKKMNVLILTDTNKHTEHNSLYAIVREMVAHELLGDIIVADRNLDKNYPFFEESDFSALFGVIIDERFNFTTGKTILSKECK